MRRNSSVPASGGFAAVEVLLRVTSIQNFLTTMNSSLDFSYMETARTGAVTNRSAVVPRRAEANPRLPAYLDGVVVWGGVPIAVQIPLLARLPC